MRVYSRQELADRATRLSQHQFCQHPADLAASRLFSLKPRESLSTIEWSVHRRKIRKPDGTQTGWSPTRSKALLPICDAHDNPDVREIIAPKPSRIGGTMIAENFAAKCLDSGPSWDVMWYLAGPTEVSSYADRVLRPLMEDHFAGRLPRPGTDGNTKTLKRVGTQTIELMVMSKTTTTNRQGGYIVFDEPDSYTKEFRSNFLEQGRQRQSDLGNDRKIYACAHPDIGWSGGIAAAWLQSTMGIYIFRCPCCGTHGSPYPTKHWPDVPRFRLNYEKAPEGTSIDRRLALARRTAVIACPGGCPLGEAEREQMIDEGSYMHKGQVLDIEAGILGEVETNETWGFWLHVLLAKQVGLASMASQLEAAVEHKERTGKTDKLKQVMVRTFGEVFEGAGEAAGLDAQALKKRTRELATAETEIVSYRLGEIPEGVLFLTQALDVGGNKFDIMVRGWDKERRSWLIERRTIRQRLHSDGVLRDIAPSKVQADWSVLEAEIDKLYPLQDNPGRALPIAVTTIDASDGNVTWKAYEFARQMDRKRWGVWRKVRCIKGATSPTAPQLPVRPTKISTDSEGKPVLPVVTLHVIGVHSLKEDALEDLAIEDRTPGHCFFARNTPDKAFEELFNEVLIDGSWVRNGDNETLDLLGYTEAGRLMLEPDRKKIRWDDPASRPVWARTVPLFLEGGDPAGDAKAEQTTAGQAKPKPRTIDRWGALSRSTKPR